jgi:hypothetical protein
MVLRYDGSTWRTELADTNGLHVGLLSIWGASSSDALAVGSACGGFVMLRLSGGNWDTPSSCGASYTVTSGSGRSTTDFYITAVNGLPPSTGSSIVHVDGQNWQWQFNRVCVGCRVMLNATWSAPSTDAFAVGDSGLTLRYDGTSWLPLTTGTNKSLKSVWGAVANRIFAVGEAGTILLYDGTAWRQQNSVATETLNGVWGTSASDVFAVGNHGTLLHYDGTTWSASASGTTEDLFSVTGSSGQVFAVGNNSTIVQFDGSHWSTQRVSAPIDFRGVWAASPTAVFAVGVPR